MKGIEVNGELDISKEDFVQATATLGYGKHSKKEVGFIILIMWFSIFYLDKAVESTNITNL